MFAQKNHYVEYSREMKAAAHVAVIGSSEQRHYPTYSFWFLFSFAVSDGASRVGTKSMVNQVI
jgi:hypothetical protein